MSRPRIAYLPRPDATPEAELNALAGVYRYILDSKNQKAVGRLPSPDGHDAERGSNEIGANGSIPR